MGISQAAAVIAAGRGFMVALDELGGLSSKALKGYGIEEGGHSCPCMVHAGAVAAGRI